jgi:hypothetical protein
MFEVGWLGSCFWVWTPFVLVPSDDVFGRFNLAAFCHCHTLNFRLFVSHGGEVP